MYEGALREKMKLKFVNSRWCIFLVFFTEFTAFIPFGINLTVLNAATPAIEVFVNDTHKERHDGAPASDEHLKFIIALAQSTLVIGTALGVICIRPLIVWLGRRSNLILIHVLAIVASVLMSVVAKVGHSYEALLVGRFLSGVCRGITFTIVPLYIAELVNRRTLGLYHAYAGCILQVGSALGNALALPHVLGGDTTWPYLMAVPAVFSVIFLLAVPFFPETPTYLMTNSIKSKKNDENDDDAKDIIPESQAGYSLLMKLRCCSDDLIMKEYKQREEEIQADASILKANFYEILSDAKYRRQLFAASFLMLSGQFAGLQAVLQYTNELFKNAGIDYLMATYYTIGLFMLQACISFIGSPMVHRWGSKRMLMIGLMIIVLGLLMLFISTVVKVEGMQHLSVVGLFVHFIGAGAGPMISLLALPSEITTQVSRPTILWISGIVFWTVATIVAFVTPYALSSIGGFTYIVFLVLVLIELFYLRFFIPNPRNKTVEEIQEKLANKGFGKPKQAEEPFLSITA